MKSITNVQGILATEELGYTDQFQARFSEYFETQHPIVRGLHHVLTGFAIFCVALAGTCFIIALYQTLIWATTGSFTSLGEATYLPTAWVNYGLSMSFLVFPWGLDAMLLRVFPAIIFPVKWYRSSKPIRYITGTRAFFAGFGIMCAGAPGAAYFIDLAAQAFQKLF